MRPDIMCGIAGGRWKLGVALLCVKSAFQLSICCLSNVVLTAEGI